MKKCAVILASLIFLTACTSAPAGSITTTPDPTATPVITPAPTEAPTATPSPTMAVYEKVSFDDWRGDAGCRMPDYTFSAPHKPLLQQGEKAAWPTGGVTLRYSADSLEEVAEIFHTTVENIKELNPDWQDNYSRNGGRYWYLKVQAEPYTVPENNVVTVTVNAPWVEGYYDRTEVSDVPASLDKQARAALASAYYFQYHWFGMHAGFMPFESVEGLPGWLQGTGWATQPPPRRRRREIPPCPFRTAPRRCSADTSRSGTGEFARRRRR